MPDNPIEVFLSYSHRDERLRVKLENHLKILERQGLISGWHDRRITAGSEWAGKIDEHLNTAHVILLLVSDEFLASDYCYDIEMKRALERHENREARVIPIILRPCLWQSAPFGKLQALPGGCPVTDWPNRDKAFLDIAKGIKTAVEEINAKPSTGSPPPSAVSTASLDQAPTASDASTASLDQLPTASAASTASPHQAPPRSRIWNIPHLRNPNFTGREEELAALCASLVAGETAALVSAQAIHGLGGVGKTQLNNLGELLRAQEYQAGVPWLRRSFSRTEHIRSTEKIRLSIP